MNKLKYW